MNKLDTFKQNYIELQYKIIDAVIEHQDKLELNNPAESQLYIQLQSAILSNIFRLKGIINTLNEVYDAKIELPEKYQKYAKIAKELVYLKNDDVILFITDGQTENEVKLEELITKVKSLPKNGRQQDSKPKK